MFSPSEQIAYDKLKTQVEARERKEQTGLSDPPPLFMAIADIIIRGPSRPAPPKTPVQEVAAALAARRFR